MKTKKLTAAFAVCAMSLLAFAAAVHAEGEVAQIGKTKYETLQAAVDAAESGDTITLINDLTDNAKLSEPVKTAVYDNFTLNLNGYTIDVTTTDGRSLYAIDNYGTLTITDSSQEQDGLITARGVENFGTMTITGGTIVSRDSNGGGACVWNEGDLSITGGTFKVTGAEVNNSAAMPISNNGNNAKAKITGGNFVSKYAYIFNQNGGQMVVEGITMEKPEDAAEYWTTVKCYTGSVVTLNNVTIHAKNSGGIEAAGGTVNVNNCTITSSGKNESSSWNAVCVSASSGGVANINGGTYESFKYGFYVFNSGGTINIEGDVKASAEVGVLKTDKAELRDSIINVAGGVYKGVISEGKETEINISGGSYSTDVSQYLAPDTAGGQGYDGMYNVISSKNKATKTGTYRTAEGDDNKYDQMWLFGADGISGSVTYNVSDGTHDKDFTYKYATIDGITKLGLIVTDIPSAQTVTVELGGQNNE